MIFLNSRTLCSFCFPKPGRVFGVNYAGSLLVPFPGTAAADLSSSKSWQWSTRYLHTEACSLCSTKSSPCFGSSQSRLFKHKHSIFFKNAIARSTIHSSCLLDENHSGRLGKGVFKRKSVILLYFLLRQ